MNKMTVLLRTGLLLFLLVTISFSVPGSAQTGRNKTNKGKVNAPVAKATGTEVNMKDFGARGDGITNDVPAFEAAKQALAKKGGGTIYFPKGKYMSDQNGWRVFAHNIRLRGDGIDKTFLLTPGSSNAPGLQMAPYRDAGWQNDPEQQYTYEDNVKEGDRFIKVKAGQGMSSFLRGTLFFISAGASYYDQYYGEFNQVDKVVGNTIYLVYPIGRDYTTDKSAWYGTLTQPFTPPAAGSTAKAVALKAPWNKRYPYPISLGNNLYSVMQTDGTNMVLKNMGKGNATAELPAGTHVYKGRAIRLTPSAAYNIQVEDMTIEGHRKTVVVSNSVQTRFDRVKFIWLPGKSKGGGWLDGDDGRDCILNDCIVQSDSIIGSQFARSFSDVKVLNCTFTQTSINFTEFNTNCEVANCSFTILNTNESKKYLFNPAIVTGGSTYRIYVHDNRCKVSNLSAAISSQPDIQTFPRNFLTKTTVTNNTIDAENCNGAINIINLGETLIDSNHITGSLSCVFAGTGASLFVEPSLPAAEQQRMMALSVCTIRNNYFEGYTNGFITRDPNNLIIENNDIRLTSATHTTGSKTQTSSGSIIIPFKDNYSLPVMTFVFRNNTFTGWNYTPHSINFNKPVTKGVSISNNLFINNIGVTRREKKFVL